MAKKLDFKKAGIKALGLGAGATAAVMIDRIPQVGALNPKIRAIGKIVLGVLIPSFIKTPIVEHVGDGMIAVGTNQLVASFTPAVQGIGDVYGDEAMYGTDDMSGSDDYVADDVSINDEVSGSDEY